MSVLILLIHGELADGNKFMEVIFPFGGLDNRSGSTPPPTQYSSLLKSKLKSWIPQIIDGQGYFLFLFWPFL
jgi:hypothetical protein